jgi:hypothetical protein
VIRGRPLTALAELDAVARPQGQATLVVETFYGVSSQPVSPNRVGSVAEAIADNDASALYRLGYSYAPFHCPECAGGSTAATTGTGGYSKTIRIAASR